MVKNLYSINKHNNFNNINHNNLKNRSGKHENRIQSNNLRYGRHNC